MKETHPARWIHVDGAFGADDLSRVLRILRQRFRLGDRIDIARSGALVRLRALADRADASMIANVTRELATMSSVRAVYSSALVPQERIEDWLLSCPSLRRADR